MADRILVLYGTTDGHTRKVATAIADTLRADGAEVDLADAKREGRSVTAEAYAAVVVAASVHRSGYQRHVRDWVHANLAALQLRPNAFVSVCLGVLEHKAETDRELQVIVERFEALTGWEPAERKIVAGALPYTRYNWLKRWMMRRIVAKAGGATDTSRDYDYTDWNDVRAFARSFGRRARLQPVPAVLAG